MNPGYPRSYRPSADDSALAAAPSILIPGKGNTPPTMEGVTSPGQGKEAGVSVCQKWKRRQER